MTQTLNPTACSVHATNRGLGLDLHFYALSGDEATAIAWHIQKLELHDVKLTIRREARDGGRVETFLVGMEEIEAEAMSRFMDEDGIDEEWLEDVVIKHLGEEWLA